MKIVHLGKYYHPAKGGAETHVRALALGQQDKGHQVTVVGINHVDFKGRDVMFSSLFGTPTTVTNDHGVSVIRIGRIINAAKFDVTTELTRTLGRKPLIDADVWHLHAPNVSMLVALSRLSKIPTLVISHHSDIIKQRLLYLFYSALESIVYRKARLLLSASEGYINGSSILKRNRDKVRILPLGINLSPYQYPNDRALSSAKSLTDKHGDILWLCVGRLIPYKGLDIAIHALKDVPGKLLIVGNGPLLTALTRQAQKIGVADRCHFLGNLPDDELIGCYLASKALWFPSNQRNEGFGQVQVEAMACGCPVINTCIPNTGVDWVSKHDESGLTIPLNDASALVDASNRILSEPELRARLSLGAKVRTQNFFDACKMVDGCLELYKTVTRDVFCDEQQAP